PVQIRVSALFRDWILPALEKVKARAPRIAVLKRLYSWLRKVKHSISLADDPNFQMLSVPQARPAQWKRVKTIPREHIELALEHATGPYRDELEILAGSGWHPLGAYSIRQGGGDRAATEARPR